MYEALKRNLGDRRDSNPRPSVPQTDALPTELRPPSKENSKIRKFKTVDIIRHLRLKIQFIQTTYLNDFKIRKNEDLVPLIT